MQRTLIAPLALLAYSSLSGVAPPADATRSGPELVHHVHPSNAVTLPEEGTSMWDLLVGLEADSDTRLIVAEPVRQNLEQTAIQLNTPLQVEASARWSVAETFLADAGYHFAVLRERGPRVLSVRGAGPARGGQGLSTARYLYVPEERVEEFAEYPATLVTTTVSLRHTDARNLSNSLRSLLADTTVLNMVPAGNSDTLILRGNGASVADAARLLRTIGEASSRPRATPAPGTVTAPPSDEN